MKGRAIYLIKFNGNHFPKLDGIAAKCTLNRELLFSQYQRMLSQVKHSFILNVPHITQQQYSMTNTDVCRHYNVCIK